MKLNLFSLNFLICSWLFILSPISGAQEEPRSGCLVRAEKKLVIDVNCVCLKFNSCMKFEKFKPSAAFFNEKLENGKPLFSEKEKSYFSQSYDHLNNIMELKSQGLGKSQAIKEHYILLDKNNQALRKSLIKNNPAFFAKTKKVYLKNMENKNKLNRATATSLMQILNSKSLSMNAPALPADKVQKKDVTPKYVKAQTSAPAAPRSTAAVPVAPPAKDRSEEEFILKNIDREKYEVKEDDSIFDIITKTYKRRAYKELLAP